VHTYRAVTGSSLHTTGWRLARRCLPVPAQIYFDTDTLYIHTSVPVPAPFVASLFLLSNLPQVRHRETS
jgi:hypothetical protein